MKLLIILLVLSSVAVARPREVAYAETDAHLVLQFAENAMHVEWTRVFIVRDASKLQVSDSAVFTARFRPIWLQQGDLYLDISRGIEPEIELSAGVVVGQLTSERSAVAYSRRLFPGAAAYTAFDIDLGHEPPDRITLRARMKVPLPLSMDVLRQFCLYPDYADASAGKAAAKIIVTTSEGVCSVIGETARTEVGSTVTYPFGPLEKLLLVAGPEADVHRARDLGK